MRGTRFEIGPGIVLWRKTLDRAAQEHLVTEIFAHAKQAPFYGPRMPLSGKPFSVEETNFGPLGWISDARGYRYSNTHPEAGRPWPEIPRALIDLWNEATHYRAPPECCLVNLYRSGAKMGLHQDRDEEDFAAPVVSLSLGESCLFRSPPKSLKAVRLDKQGLVLLAAVLNDAGNPVGKCHPRLPQRLFEQAEFQMRMRIHQAGQNRHIAQVPRRPSRFILAHRHNSPTGDRDNSALNRRLIDRHDPASAIGNRFLGLLGSIAHSNLLSARAPSR